MPSVSCMEPAAIFTTVHSAEGVGCSTRSNFHARPPAICIRRSNDPAIAFHEAGRSLSDRSFLSRAPFCLHEKSPTRHLTITFLCRCWSTLSYRPSRIVYTYSSMESSRILHADDCRSSLDFCTYILVHKQSYNDAARSV